MNINSNSEVKVSYFFKYTVKIANFCVPLPHAKLRINTVVVTSAAGRILNEIISDWSQIIV